MLPHESYLKLNSVTYCCHCYNDICLQLADIKVHYIIISLSSETFGGRLKPGQIFRKRNQIIVITVRESGNKSLLSLYVLQKCKSCYV